MVSLVMQLCHPVSFDRLPVIGGMVDKLYFDHKTTMTGDIVPGTLGNLCLEVRNSEV